MMQFLRPILRKQQVLTYFRSQSYSTNAGKVYEFRTYAVHPSRMRDYMKVMEEVLPERIKASKMNGFWYTELGGLNEAMYLWEYGMPCSKPEGLFMNYSSLAQDLCCRRYSFSHRTTVRRGLAEDEEWRDVCLPKLLPFLSSQTNALIKPFSWYEPNLDPVKGYGMYELVMYDLKPGMVSQFEHVMQQILLTKCDYPKPLGFWYTEFGHANRVLSIHPHENLEKRENHMKEMMSNGEWKELWRDSMKFMNDITVKAMIPGAFSPLQ